MGSFPETYLECQHSLPPNKAITWSPFLQKERKSALKYFVKLRKEAELID